MNLLIRAKLSWKEALGYSWLLFDFFSVMDSLSFLLSMFVQANTPADLNVTHQRNGFDFNEKQKKRICAKCNIWKPPRAHHCRYCQRCIIMYDHHCSWVGNCIGHGNLHFFVQYLVYTSSGAFYSLLLLSANRQVIWSYYSNETTIVARQKLFCFVWLMYTTILFIFSGLVTSFRLFKTIIHVRLGITAYESLLLDSDGEGGSHNLRQLAKGRRGLTTSFWTCWRRSGVSSDDNSGDVKARGEKVNFLLAILQEEKCKGQTLKNFFGRRWPMQLLFPLSGDAASELVPAMLSWEDLSVNNASV